MGGCFEVDMRWVISRLCKSEEKHVDEEASSQYRQHSCDVQVGVNVPFCF